MSDRAVSEVVSYVLVFALIVSAVGIVSVSGLSTLQDTRDAEQIDNAERAFNVLSDNMADIHQRDAPSRATEITLSEARLETGENVTMNVTVSGASDQPGPWETRPIVYTGSEDRRLAYEGGAVFRQEYGGSLRVEEPPFVITDNRVLIPIISLNRPDRQALAGSNVLVRAQKQETTVSSFNDVGTVNVTISDSQHADLWRDYFESHDIVDDDNGCTGSNPVTCTIEPTGDIDHVYIVHHEIAVSIDN